MGLSFGDYKRRSRSKRKLHRRTFQTAVSLGFIKEKNGKISVRCNKPIRTPRKKKKFAVLACNSREMQIVRFGDPKMSHFREGTKSKQPRRVHGDKKRRKSFKRRHRCHEKDDIMTPGYWSCKWSW